MLVPNYYLALLFGPLVIAFPTAGTALMLLIRRRRAQQPIDFQPGYWLLCVTGVLFLYFAISTVTKSAAKPAMVTMFGQTPGSLLIDCGESIGLIVVLLLAGFLLPVRPLWRCVLLMPCGIVGYTAYAEIWWLVQQDTRPFATLNFAELVFHLVGLLVLLVVAVWDFATTRHPRDRLHWLGVTNAALLGSPPVLIAIYQALLI